MTDGFIKLFEELDECYSDFIEFEEFEYNENLMNEVYFMLDYLDSYNIDLTKYEINDFESDDGEKVGVEYWMKNKKESWVLGILIHEQDLNSNLIEVSFVNDAIVDVYTIEINKKNCLNIVEIVKDIEELFQKRNKRNLKKYLKSKNASIL